MKYNNSLLELRNFLKYLKNNNENILISELKEMLIYYKEFYEIKEILNMFVCLNIDYLLQIEYLKEY